MIHTVKDLNVVNEPEVEVFLEFSCFFYDLTDDNLISGFSAFSKSYLSIWKFLIHLLLKPSLKDFEYYIASMWNEQNCPTFFGIRIKTNLSQSYSHGWVFQMCWHTVCITFTALSFRFLNSSTGIPSPQLALFIVMLPKAYFTSHARMSGSKWVTRPSWLSGSLRSFCTVHLYVLATSS